MRIEDTQLNHLLDCTDKFTRSYAMFGLLMLMLFILRAISQHFLISFLVVLFMILYVSCENELQIVMRKMSSSSSYFNRIPYFLVKKFFLLLTFSLVGILLFIPIIPIHTGSKENKLNQNGIIHIKLIDRIVPDHFLFSTYLISQLETLTIFMFSSSIKCLLLGTGLVGFKVTRRGFFGVFQRIFILIRNLVVMPLWINFFLHQSFEGNSQINHGENSTIFFSFHLFRNQNQEESTHINFWCFIYLVMKFWVQGWLLIDLFHVINNYGANKKTAYKPVSPEDVDDDCIICQDSPKEPVMLSCGHIFCYKCVYRWLRDHYSCPTCRAKVSEMKTIELSGGGIPLATLLSSF
ncbi:hypothetical protein TRFO_14541 [Tritrichomonas foetus]|uniref:RING-type E3 ubiquitin transferase n=1 Tax=Tritrichomonas foetus TaxID=1144522 RepID=A0A1J4KV65_9EUKA|nr:hypothetical protein TRFO_14541 [Tritrichomonas foetus]|eukprot:OHT15034.1 hypothetical protein TRFO_14541 [Tritrichomonas foetus]